VTRIEEIKKIFASLKLPSSTLWHELESQDQLQKNETFKNSDNLEKLSAFEDYMRELERLEQQKEKLKTKRQERRTGNNLKTCLCKNRGSAKSMPGASGLSSFPQSSTSPLFGKCSGSLEARPEKFSTTL